MNQSIEQLQAQYRSAYEDFKKNVFNFRKTLTEFEDYISQAETWLQNAEKELLELKMRKSSEDLMSMNCKGERTEIKKPRL